MSHDLPPIEVDFTPPTLVAQFRKPLHIGDTITLSTQWFIVTLVCVSVTERGRPVWALSKQEDPK